MCTKSGRGGGEGVWHDARKDDSQDPPPPARPLSLNAVTGLGPLPRMLWTYSP